jgi:type I pantothenate kinase
MLCPNETITIDRPDILIVEGLNVLQSRRAKDDKAVPFVSDFFDFSIYIDAEESALERWYMERFRRLRETAFRDPNSYFHKYSRLDSRQADDVALSIWKSINLENLRENVRPTRPRADLILTKGDTHGIDEVALRKI